MRGIKRKRDIVTLVESVDHWFVASEGVEGLPEMAGIKSHYSHTVTVGERPNRVSPSQADPVNRHVTGETLNG